MAESTTGQQNGQGRDLDIRIKTSFRKSYPVTADILQFFRGQSGALHFWLYAATMPTEFILRRNHIKKNILGIGETRFRKVVKFMKELGLLQQRAIRERGEFVGSEYLITDFHNSAPQPSKPLSNEDLTVEPISDMSITYQHNIQGGDQTESEGKRGVDLTNESMVPFSADANADDHRQAFIQMFDGVQTYQTFDDKPTKRRELNHIIHGHDPLNLEALNDQGAGVFLTINETDGNGRKADNIKRVRAVYADLDGAPLVPVLEYCPHMVVESSPGRYHAYWLTDDVPLDKFRDMQKSIITRFGADKTVTDLSRVMRIPGYRWNKKDPGYMTRIIYTSTRADKFTHDELTAMFPPLPAVSRPTESNKPLKINGTCKGERNDTLCKILGGIAKRGGDIDQMTAAAHEFAAKCTPRLSKRAVQTTLAGARQWIRS